MARRTVKIVRVTNRISPGLWTSANLRGGLVF